MFENDSLTGLSRNEIDGAVDEFEVQSTGSSHTVYHDNLPAIHKFYAFAVNKIVD